MLDGFRFFIIIIMITREDYLNALELIDKYNRQFNKLPIESDPKSIEDIKLCEFSKKMDVSRRLENAFCTASRDFGWERLSDFNGKKFLKLRNVGKKCLMEFEWYLELYKEQNN